MNLFDKLGI